MNSHKKLQDLAISDSGFVFDPYTGNTFSVNPSAKLILDALKSGAERAGILATLREHFVEANGDLERDLDDFLSTLRRESLLTGDGQD